MYVKMNMEI